MMELIHIHVNITIYFVLHNTSMFWFNLYSAAILIENAARAIYNGSIQKNSIIKLTQYFPIPLPSSKRFFYLPKFDFNKTYLN